MKQRILKNNIPAGNWENKYNFNNPFTKIIVGRFINTVKSLIAPYKTEITSITEVGCGEGYLINAIRSLLPGAEIKANDFSEEIIAIARQNFPFLNFYVKDIYETGAAESADLLISCEVLEHLEKPEKALELLSKTTKKFCVVSVPNEPLWRILNVLRGKYLSQWGNTPGHINHWSPAQFVKLVASYMEVLTVKSVIPWTIALCKPR